MHTHTCTVIKDTENGELEPNVLPSCKGSLPLLTTTQSEESIQPASPAAIFGSIIGCIVVLTCGLFLVLIVIGVYCKHKKKQCSQNNEVDDSSNKIYNQLFAGKTNGCCYMFVKHNAVFVAVRGHYYR